MKVPELREALTEMGFRLEAANICGVGAPEGLTIAEGNKWEVCYYERGKKFEISVHTLEKWACADFLTRALELYETGFEYYKENFKAPLL